MDKYKLYNITLGLFVAVLLISNIASTKIVQIWKFSFDGGTILFPLAYIFGDVLTEVYGYKLSRRIIWTGFFSLALMILIFYIVAKLPSAEGWDNQEAYATILLATPRIVLGSFVAYFSGEFTNSFILSKMKIITKGKHLWARTISSTLAGQIIDTGIFCLIAFYGLYSNELLLVIIISNYIFKVGIEILLTPVTYKVIKYYKTKENIDVYDLNTNYNPFKFD